MAGLFGGGASAMQLDPNALNGSDKLMMLGAMLGDLGNAKGPEQTMQMRNMLMQRQMLNGAMGGLFGGQAAQGQAPQGPAGQPGAPAPAAPTLDLHNPATQRSIAMLSMINPTAANALVGMATAARPHVTFAPDNSAIDDTSPAMVGKTFPKVDPGQILMRDAQGNPTGIANLNGYTDAVGQTEAAKEGAKAALDLVDVPQSDGSTVKMPRSQAVQMLGGQAGGAPAMGGGSAPSMPLPNMPPSLGVSQTPQAKAQAEAVGKGMGERAIEQPKSTATLSDADRTTDFSRNTIHEILGETQDPKTGKWTKTNPSQVNWATTGVMGATDEIPGSPAHNLKARLDTILSQTAVSELQKMRDESPTGGALGRVTQQEINMLAAMRGSIEQTQSGKQLEASLRHHLDQLDKLATIRNTLYQQQYPDGQPQSAAAPRTPTMSGKGWAIRQVK